MFRQDPVWKPSSDDNRGRYNEAGDNYDNPRIARFVLATDNPTAWMRMVMLGYANIWESSSNRCTQVWCVCVAKPHATE